MKRFKRKGQILIMTLLVIPVFVVILGFSFDISRMMYQRMYTRNLASVVAISIVNETAYGYHTLTGGPGTYLIYNKDVIPFELQGNYNGELANKAYATRLVSMNEAGMSADYNVTGIYLNPITYNNNQNVSIATDYKRFMQGSDGVNGEVEVVITATWDLFFINGILGKDQITVQESAVAQAYAHVTGTELKEQTQFKEENINYVF